VESPALEALGPHREAVAIPVHDAHAITSPGEKDVEVPAERVLGQRAAHDRREAIDPFSPIDRLRRDEDPDARRQTQHARPSSTRASS
jgi:hypothetical protein